MMTIQDKLELAVLVVYSGYSLIAVLAWRSGRQTEPLPTPPPSSPLPDAGPFRTPAAPVDVPTFDVPAVLALLKLPAKCTCGADVRRIELRDMRKDVAAPHEWSAQATYTCDRHAWAERPGVISGTTTCPTTHSMCQQCGRRAPQPGELFCSDHCAATWARSRVADPRYAPELPR